MQLLASPIIWAVLFVFYFFTRGSSDNGTDLSVFQDSDPTKAPTQTATTSNGTVIKNVSITPAKAQTIALALWKEFDNYITSEANIMNSLKGLNYSDLMLVYDKFGIHKQDLLTNTGSTLIGTNKDLLEWIADEVTSDVNKKKLSNQFPTVF